MTRRPWVMSMAGLAVFCLACGGTTDADMDRRDGEVAAAAATPAASSEAADDSGRQNGGNSVPLAVKADNGSQATGSEATEAAPRGDAAKQFPPLDYLQRIPIAYRIAAAYPDLLAGIPCYCPCALYGHGGLVDCYRSQHAAACTTCLDEALLAGQLYEAQRSRGEDNPEAVRAAVKDRYRRSAAGGALQEFPLPQTRQARAAIQVCSDCHQPFHPAYHSVQEWGQSLERMEAYARQSDRMPSSELWRTALEYVRSVAGQYPPETSRQVGESLRKTVESLQANEGEAVYYPSGRDEIIDAAWFDRMVEAYRAARELPTEVLAGTSTGDPLCEAAGHASVLECLNSWHAVTMERTVELVEELAATR